MLAEPRRKVRIGPNPRGKFFTEDDDNKGKQMLKKLGWKSGEGLGANSHGMSEPIKPKVNTDSRGLGYDMKQDPWVAHNEEFEQLLKSLNTDSDRKQTLKDDAAKEGELDRGLENKSKGSRSRIHYHKFVRNKDLSKASVRDMSCIFGKSLHERNEIPPPVGTSEESENSPEESTECSSNRNEADVSLCENANVRSDCVESVNRKKSKKKKKHRKEKDEISNVPVPAVENEGDDAVIQTEPESEPKRKKKKRRKANDSETQRNDEMTNDSSEVVPASTENEYSESKRRKKERKAKKAEKFEPIPLDPIISTESDEVAVEAENHSKRKKRKHKHKNQEEEISNYEKLKLEEPNTDANVTQESSESEPKKKKKKRKHELETDCSTLVAPLTLEVQIETDLANQKLKKKKKRDKSKAPSDCNDTGNCEDSIKETPNCNEDKEVNTCNKVKYDPNDKVETYGSLQFINRGSIVDYFRNKMLNRKLAAVKVA